MPRIEVHVVQVRIQDQGQGEETNDKLDLVFLNFLYMQATLLGTDILLI